MATISTLFETLKIKALLRMPFSKLMRAISKEGFSINALLAFYAKKQPHCPIFIEKHCTTTYGQFYDEVIYMSYALSEYGIRAGQRVGFQCDNSISLLRAVFATERIGATAVLLHTGRPVKGYFDFLFTEQQLEALPTRAAAVYFPRRQGKIVLQTSGTTGEPKAVHTAVHTLLAPFCALLERMHFHTYRYVYVATPFFHGYGLAFLTATVAAGHTVVLSRRFDASLLEAYPIEAITVVPTLLTRFSKTPSLRCIASGSAPLQNSEGFESILYNLYGTSEVGLISIATPEERALYPTTIGSPINGLSIRFNKGELIVNNKRTGDIVEEREGLLFIKGRLDERIISGGENVFPQHIEQIIKTHPKITDVAITSEVDSHFGERVIAYVVADGVGERDIQAFCKQNLANYECPKKIYFVEALPYNELGKINRKLLPKPL
ncbi:class I adenylate-forming enzyme family protein [Metasolibacillus fluoroglycofenilyticus]|uniref:class I adenylate-forming enzyme family protein n=1 Tax=Metasolibacillus fluoroglycofenilyticus TaxID=1239396 RepID=UPI00129049FE|nr:AMP-binding protein [Metasolibacillus fluoroglycofenilyticus]